jgi:pimeloyl-ACP methyl ester carboxylesterase
VLALVDALNLKSIDLLGFSMGGVCVQYVALTRPTLVRRLILAGTRAGPPGIKAYESVSGLPGVPEDAPWEPIKALNEAETVEEGKKALAFSFFYDDDVGRAHFEQYWSRVTQRSVEGEDSILTLQGPEATKNQFQAAIHSREPDMTGQGSFDRLHTLKMPVFVANGDNDVLIPSSRSWELYRLIENAALVMYPKAGHGFLWQYAEMFGGNINRFLDSEEFGKLEAKL